MIQVRRTIKLKDGVTADLLFTPHIAVYEERAGLRNEVGPDSGTMAVMERYADLMYLAALNAWELDGHGTMEDYPHTRGDFHALMQADPKEFVAAMKFAVSALTGKTEKELTAEEEKRRQAARNEAKTGEGGEAGDVKKKPSMFSRIMGRLNRSS